LRERAQVRRDDGARYQPRLHDLRHYVPFLTISGNLEGLLEHLGSVGWAANVLGQSPDIVSRSYKLFRKSRSWSAGR
jgi:hypothetical protein